MYNAIKTLKSKKFIVFLMIIQLAYGITILNDVFSLVGVENKKLNNFNKMVDNENTYLIEVEGGEYIYNFYDDLDDIYNEIGTLESVRKTYVVFPFPMIVDKIDNINNDKYENIKNGYLHQSKILIDSNFNNKYKLKVVEGRTLDKNDFNKDYRKENIPILLGNDFIGKKKIGEIYNINDIASVNKENRKENDPELIYEDINFEVVGFLEKDAIPVTTDKTGAIASSVIFSDSITIIPAVKNYLSFGTGVALGDMGVYVECYEGITEEKIKSDIENILKKYKEESKVKDHLEPQVRLIEREGTKAALKNNINNSKILGGILVFLSTLGIASTMIGDIKNRKNEFGIKISQGASINTICKEMIYEILILVSLSVILALIFLLSKYGIKAITIKLILTDIIIISLITTIISILPIRIIKKIEIVKLLRGK
ncbi:hypothetical protein QJR26_03190 [Clostridium baratii]